MEAYNRQVHVLLSRTWGIDKTEAALDAYYRGEYTNP
jgi:hypothetical protein